MRKKSLFTGAYNRGPGASFINLLTDRPSLDALSPVRYLLLLVLLSSCYRHARRDEPAPAPESVSAAMVSVPAGSFVMGDRNGEPDEYPVREIRLSGFRLDRTEVTNEAYASCVLAKACDPVRGLNPRLAGPRRPAVGVTFDDAQKFCRWVGKRLPTEAEWEFAARGDSQRKFPWKGAFDPAKANTAQQGDGHEWTSDAGSFGEGSSAFGALDMAGNAAEWVADFYDPTHYKNAVEDTDPTGPASGRERVVRGGSYRDPSHLVRGSARARKIPTESDSTIGFRCAAD